MVTIKKITARQILDSRGNPTVEARIWSSRACGIAKVPSGASTGVHEALELRDGTKAYGGKAVQKAVANINKTIAQKIVGKSFSSMKELDEFLISLDGTVNKARLGANAMLAVSIAFARLLASSRNQLPAQYIARLQNTKKMSLPLPFANVLNGGVHAGNALEMQEFMIAPLRTSSFANATRVVSETYHELKTIIAKKFGASATNVGDEGGFAPPISRPSQALDLIMKAVANCGYDNQIGVAMDAAASEFFHNKAYLNSAISSSALARRYQRLMQNYPLISLEDPFDQDDFDAWKSFTAKHNNHLQIVGDDVTVSNPARIQLAADLQLCNSLLLKPNQIGTLSESLTSAQVALRNKWSVMVSHRSGETEDPFIADLAVGLGTGQIKLGAPCRSDRVAKYNRLLFLEEELGLKIKRSGLNK